MKIDGMDDPQTRQAVLDLQIQHRNLVRDGELGPRTFVELMRHVARSNAKQRVGAAERAALGELAGDAVSTDRAVQLAREYGTKLGLAATRGGPVPNLHDAFKPSSETGDYDADAIEVAAVLSLPHRTDMPMTHKILDRDADIIYAAIGAHAKVLNDEERRKRQGG